MWTCSWWEVDGEARAGEVLSERSVLLQASWRET